MSKTVTLSGYINAVGRDSKVLSSPTGNFVEQIVPKTFQRALEKVKSVKLLFNHDHQKEIASTETRTLELYEDDIGLKVKCTISDPEIIKKAEKGELRGWSFGFHKVKETWEERADGIRKRYLEEIDLTEVSLLDVAPAYTGTLVEMRDGEEVKEMRSFTSQINVQITEEKAEEITTQHELRQIEVLKLKGKAYEY